MIDLSYVNKTADVYELVPGGKTQKQLPTRFELVLQDSESWVLTATLREHIFGEKSHIINQLFVK